MPLIYGATGFTGRCCVAACEAAGIDYLVGGRNRARLEGVAGPHCVGVRLADTSDLTALTAAFAETGCVVSTVGPFARHGEPVLQAAIAAEVHYVDTTAEQSFLHTALRHHESAKDAGVTALPACGVEYAPMLLAAELLGPGPVESYLWLDDFLPTRGSVRSMVAMAGVGPTPIPKKVHTTDRTGFAIRIPGAEEVLLHPDSRTHLVLRRHEAWAFSLLWPVFRLLPVPLPRLGDAIARHIKDPTLTQRKQAGFTVVVRRGDQALRIDGTDVYASTGLYAVTLAHLLEQGKARQAGVLAVGQALDAESSLAELDLRPYTITLST